MVQLLHSRIEDTLSEACDAYLEDQFSIIYSTFRCHFGNPHGFLIDLGTLGGRGRYLGGFGVIWGIYSENFEIQNEAIINVENNAR